MLMVLVLALLVLVPDKLPDPRSPEIA